MFLIVEYDLDPNLTPEDIDKFTRWLEMHPNCVGTYTYEAATPPQPHSGRAAYACVSDTDEQYLEYLFSSLKQVRNREARWEAPAVM